MKQEQFTTTILIAEQGKYLIQAAEVDIHERTFGETVALGRNDVPANWREITATEKESYESQREEQINNAR